MTKVILLSATLLTACASTPKEVVITKTVTVDKVVVVSCVNTEDVPTKPDWSVPKLRKYDSDAKKVQALRIDNELSIPYQKALEIIVDNCAAINKH